MLQEGSTVVDLESHLEKISKAHYTDLPPDKNAVVTYAPQNLLDIVPGRMINNPIGPFMPWMIIYFLTGLAGIVLITSCFNFTNLSIARSISRAREIGVRKVTGAARWQIFTQFLSESVVVALFALVLAIALLYIIKPLAENLSFAQILHWKMSANYVVYLVFVVFAIAVGVLAGLFPATVLSGFQPVKVLKNLGNTRLMSKTGLRKALLVVQFSLSMVFILTVIVLFNQLNMFLHNDNGFSAEHKLILQKGQGSVETLKSELLKQGAVTSVSLASHIPLSGVSYGVGFKKSMDDKDWKGANYFSVDEDYLTNMEIPLVAGKFFSSEAGLSNQNFIVINEVAVEEFELGSPIDAIGKTLIIDRDSTEKQVIGVVRNYYHEIFDERLGPLVLIHDPERYSLVQIAYTGSYTDAARTVERVWTGINPGLKAEVKDFRITMGALFDIVFGTVAKVLGFISIIAVLISCLGLLGMATYTIESRKKEIAIRKIVGSSNRSLVYILSKGYIGILLISFAIAIPLAYYMNMFWLQALDYHVSVDLFTISIGILILLFFGLFTVGSQTIQAIWINPVENLKSE
jgi:putative ABC transport system permease protein